MSLSRKELQQVIGWCRAYPAHQGVNNWGYERLRTEHREAVVEAAEEIRMKFG